MTTVDAAGGSTVAPSDPQVSCPVCTQCSNRLFSRDGYWLRECHSCRHQFFELVVADDHVARTYDDSYFNGGGAGYPGYLHEERLLRERGRWYAKRLADYMPVGTVLDIGAAAGFILKGFQDAGWRGEGIEPNEAMARHARETLQLPVATVQLERFKTGNRFDVISMIQVIAHIADPRRALAQVAAMLKPGGYLLIETWNSRSWTARLLGKAWHEYSPPSVLHCFSPQSLSILAAKAGLSEVARGRPSKWISAEHAKTLASHKYGQSGAAHALIRMIPDGVRVPYPADDLVWLLLKSD